MSLCKLRHPFMAVVAGPTSCEKKRLGFWSSWHASQMIDPPQSRIHYCYGEYQYFRRLFVGDISQRTSPNDRRLQPAYVVNHRRPDVWNQSARGQYFHEDIASLLFVWLRMSLTKTNSPESSVSMHTISSYSKILEMPISLPYYHDRCTPSLGDLCGSLPAVYSAIFWWTYDRIKI